MRICGARDDSAKRRTRLLVAEPHQHFTPSGALNMNVRRLMLARRRVHVDAKGALVEHLDQVCDLLRRGPRLPDVVHRRLVVDPTERLVIRPGDLLLVRRSDSETSDPGLDSGAGFWLAGGTGRGMFRSRPETSPRNQPKKRVL